MSCKYVSAAVAVFAIAAAMAESSIAVAQIETCLKLNDIDKLLVEKDGVYKSFEACDTMEEEERANLTIGAEAIYFIYKAVADAKYLRLDKLVTDTSTAYEIHECITAVTAKLRTLDNAQKNVGLEGTHSREFDVDRCTQSFELRTCIEDVFYSNSTLTVDAKAQKDIFMKAFDVTDAICVQILIVSDRSSSQQFIPSILVIFGSVLMLLKLFICVV